MIRSRKQSWCAAALLATGFVAGAMPATAAPVNLVLSGSIFNVSDPSDVFGTAIGDTYSILLSYDPTPLVATPVETPAFTRRHRARRRSH